MKIEVSHVHDEAPLQGDLCATSVLLLSLSLLPAAFAQNQAAPETSSNNRTQNQSQTADQQKDRTSDRELTAKIRHAIVADQSLSTYGHNVKILVSGGTVTLKGPVHSEEEKEKIAATAAEIVGQGRVTNQITVKQ